MNDSVTPSAALHAVRCRANICQEAPQPGAVQVPVAQDSAAARAHPTLEQVDPSATLIAIGEHLRTAKDLVLHHGPYKMRVIMRIAKDHYIGSDGF